MTGRGKLLLAVVLTALVASGVTWWAMGALAGEGNRAAAEPATVDIALEPFTTNLRDGHVIQVSVVLRVEGERAKETVEQAHLADVRHSIHRVLRGMTAADVAGADGMDRLQQALLKGLKADEALREIPLREVLLMDLIVQ